MRVLVTGALGNIGQNTVPQLLEQGNTVMAFDLRTETNERRARRLRHLDRVDVIWGDIRSPEDVRDAVRDVDCIVHLAAVLPPASEEQPELTRAVNVGGTRNVVEAARDLEQPPRLIYTSSVATYGHSTGRGPPKTATDPQVAVDVYSETKIEAERLVRESGLQWVVLRLSAAPAVDYDWLARSRRSEMFHVPLSQRVEFVHPRDVGLAITNAVTADVVGRVLLIAGGERCRMTYREFIKRALEAMGIGMLPEEAFIVPDRDEDYYHTDFMDTTESQALLQYQTRTYDDYLEDLRRSLGWRRWFIPLVRWYIRRRMLSMSPYYARSAQSRQDGTD